MAGNPDPVDQIGGIATTEDVSKADFRDYQIRCRSPR
jgi:hypothetical protein